MGTTTKMAIPYPEATGLVKDGWEDMKDIADQVDAKSGLILISTTSFSAVSSVSLANNTFTSSFRNYKIIVNSTTTINNYLTARLRVAGTDNSAGNYGSGWNYQDVTGGGVGSDISGTLTGTSWVRFGYLHNGQDGTLEIDLYQPQINGKTFYLMKQMRQDGTYEYGAGVHTGTISADSLSLIPASGNITGSVNTYGYNV